MLIFVHSGEQTDGRGEQIHISTASAGAEPRPAISQRAVPVDDSDATSVPLPAEIYRLPQINNSSNENSLPSLSEVAFGVPGPRFGLFEWPEEVPQRILDLLAKKSKVKGVKPLPKDFTSLQGLFFCPLCPKGKEFARLTIFTKHLWKH